MTTNPKFIAVGLTANSYFSHSKELAIVEVEEEDNGQITYKPLPKGERFYLTVRFSQKNYHTKQYEAELLPDTLKLTRPNKEV